MYTRSKRNGVTTYELFYNGKVISYIRVFEDTSILHWLIHPLKTFPLYPNEYLIWKTTWIKDDSVNSIKQQHLLMLKKTIEKEYPYFKNTDKINIYTLSNGLQIPVCFQFGKK